MPVNMGPPLSRFREWQHTRRAIKLNPILECIVTDVTRGRNGWGLLHDYSTQMRMYFIRTIRDLAVVFLSHIMYQKSLEPIKVSQGVERTDICNATRAPSYCCWKIEVGGYPLSGRFDQDVVDTFMTRRARRCWPGTMQSSRRQTSSLSVVWVTV